MYFSGAWNPYTILEAPVFRLPGNNLEHSGGCLTRREMQHTRHTNYVSAVVGKLQAKALIPTSNVLHLSALIRTSQ
jgi:hypothetical protein